MSKVNADWHVSLDIECPYCNHYFDLIGSQYVEGMPQVCSNESDLEIEIHCPKCKSDLVITSTSY